jgi:hypothetical protein
VVLFAGLEKPMLVSDLGMDIRAAKKTPAGRPAGVGTNLQDVFHGQSRFDQMLL